MPQRHVHLFTDAFLLSCCCNNASLFILNGAARVCWSISGAHREQARSQVASLLQGRHTYTPFTLTTLGNLESPFNLNMNVFRRREETRIPGEKSHRHGENMQQALTTTCNFPFIFTRDLLNLNHSKHESHEHLCHMWGTHTHHTLVQKHWPEACACVLLVFNSFYEMPMIQNLGEKRLAVWHLGSWHLPTPNFAD